MSGGHEYVKTYVSRGCKTARLDWELSDRLRGEGHTMAYIAERLGVASSTLRLARHARDAVDTAVDGVQAVE
jgi:hypothetical protein